MVARRALLIVALAVVDQSAALSAAPSRHPEPLRRSTLIARATRVAQPVLVASPVATSAAIFGAANVLGLAISATKDWHYHLDLIGTGIFAVAAFATRGVTLAQRCSAAAVGTWATKLASFLFWRALRTKRDGRLEDTLASFSGQAGFWLISFAWGFVVSLPHTLAAGVPVPERPAFGRVHAVGVAVFVAGLALETAADVQKTAFKAVAANAGRFCDVGVWRLCQHPNWLGNLMLWTGILLLNAPTLLATGGKLTIGPVAVPAVVGTGARFALAAVSPAFLLLLFRGQANGVPPLNKGFEQTLARFGAEPAWQAYDAVTPRLFPTLKSVRAWLGA